MARVGEALSDKQIRRIAPSDLDRAVELVHELAGYEKAPDECHLTVEQLRSALFGPAPALFGHVAELDGDVVGVALWFLNFSTWDGVHGIYLEDLFVRPAHRGAGLGRALLRALAQECVANGYSRLQWSVLNWNEPAIGFYRSLGALPLEEWTVFRVDGDALATLGGPSERLPG
jgi:GNAT superfamily N-acetyltransferase